MSDTSLCPRRAHSIDATEPGADVALERLLPRWFWRGMLTGRSRYLLRTRRNTLVIDQIRALTVAADGSRWLDVVLSPVRGIAAVPRRAIRAPTDRRGALVNAEAIMGSSSVGPSICPDGDLRACDEDLQHIWAPHDGAAALLEDCGYGREMAALCPAGGIVRMMTDLWRFGLLVEVPQAKPEVLGFTSVNSLRLDEYGLSVEICSETGHSGDAFAPPRGWRVSPVEGSRWMRGRDIVVVFEASTS